MKYTGLLILFFLTLTGCQPDRAKVVRLPELTLPAPQKISDLDKNYQRYHKNSTLIQVQGKIVYQSKALGDWAYIEDDTGMALISLVGVSPNLALPSNKVGSIITVEGRISPDDTVINEYLIVPTTYKLG
ncbi:hypothetical protein NO2_1120 [Candidatus Termititenax persephonae]|uniref:Bacterial OB-fold domain-containing protein n=1 Tax=Candidatus Termititenax persephonae TaxID=2218525 RepID=A0A388THH1_9BACT|nr:hypothetical protein NO2_1120 [Candidatus Termititenax persephonae]